MILEILLREGLNGDSEKSCADLDITYNNIRDLKKSNVRRNGPAVSFLKNQIGVEGFSFRIRLKFN